MPKAGFSLTASSYSFVVIWSSSHFSRVFAVTGANLFHHQFKYIRSSVNYNYNKPSFVRGKCESSKIVSILFDCKNFFL